MATETDKKKTKKLNKRKADQEEKDNGLKKSKVTCSQMDEIRKIWADNPDLLSPVDNEDDEIVDKFYRVLELAFDVDPKIIDRIGNRDVLDFPDDVESGDINVGFIPNFFQLINSSGEEHDAIHETINYLFRDTDVSFDEDYDFSEKELNLRKIFHKKLNQKYDSKEQYFNRVGVVLFRNTSLYDEFKYVFD